MNDYIYMYIYVGVIKRWILISIIEIKGSIIFFNTFKVTSNCLMIFFNFFLKKIRHNKIKLGVAKTTFYLRNHRRLFCILEHIAVSSIFSSFSVAFFSFVDELGDNLGSSEGHPKVIFVIVIQKSHFFETICLNDQIPDCNIQDDKKSSSWNLYSMHCLKSAEVLRR